MDSASGGETLEERSSKEVMVLWWRFAAVKLKGIVELGQVSCSLGVDERHVECACCCLSRLKIQAQKILMVGGGEIEVYDLIHLANITVQAYCNIDSR